MGFRKLISLDYIVVHCSATPPGMDIGADEIRQWHLKRGWLDIGYHFVIRRDGTIEQGRPRDVQGAGARGYNHNSIHICLVGGVRRGRHKGNNSVGFVVKDVPENNFTPEQFASLRKLIFEELVPYAPKAVVLGHRDLPGVKKACPCFDVREWIRSLRAKKETPKQ